MVVLAEITRPLFEARPPSLTGFQVDPSIRLIFLVSTRLYIWPSMSARFAPYVTSIARHGVNRDCFFRTIRLFQRTIDEPNQPTFHSRFMEHKEGKRENVYWSVGSLREVDGEESAGGGNSLPPAGSRSSATVRLFRAMAKHRSDQGLEGKPGIQSVRVESPGAL